MGKQQKHGVLVRSGGHRKEGIPVPVQAKHITLRDGTAGTAYGINLNDVDIPERHYHARTCGADFAHQEVELLFAQPRRDKPDQLRTLLIVSMPAIAIPGLLESIARMQSPSLDEIAAKTNIESESVTTFHTEAEQTVEVDANIVAMAFSGNEACLDFYESSPFSLAALPVTNSLNLIPVVRVNTRTSLALGMIARLRELQKKFPPAHQQWETTNE
jgi:hypothetical protein